MGFSSFFKLNRPTKRFLPIFSRSEHSVDSNQSLTAGDDPQGSSLSPFWTIAFELSASCLGLLIEAQEPRMWLRSSYLIFPFARILLAEDGNVDAKVL